MRAILLSSLLLLPTLLALPTAHACFGPTPTVPLAGEAYVIVAPLTTSSYIVEVNDVALGIDICWWTGTATWTYKESNTVPGLQTGGSCTPDMLVAHTFVGVRGQCIV